MGFRYATLAALALTTSDSRNGRHQNHHQKCSWPHHIKTIDEPNPSPKSIGMMTMAFGS
jgi:hypothetical protein